MKKVLYALGTLLVVALLAGAVGRWYIGTAERSASTARLPGLRERVEVWRDSLGVPHLWAASEEDLARAMGYVHAQDRLWQMELFRRVADGRLAEALGEEALEADRFLRTLGLGRAAALEERTLEPEQRRLLTAYAGGVNTYLRQRSGALPPEFLLLRVQPEPWTIRHSLSIGKLMAWDLADWQSGLDLQRAFDLVGPELAGELLPRYPEWGVHILPGAAPSGSDKAPATRAPVGTGSSRTLPGVPPLAAALLDAASASHASNSWVIGPRRSRSGKPILANDPHLALRAPSLWYLAALHGGRVASAGVTIPGAPFVILGHTERVAWGFTNAMVDDVDFFVEKVDPADPSRYLTPSGPRAFEVRAETIQVKGKQPVIIRVRTTRHGPVMSDVEKRSGDRLLAMQWTAHLPSTSFAATLAMNRARSAGELVRALRLFNDPHQNVVFADAGGTIGYWMVGRVPVRRSGDGTLPVPGWTGEADWQGFLDFDEHPHAIDPAEGFIVTANNAQVGPGYPHHIGSSYASPYRAMRIREMLDAGRSFTAQDVAAQQMDVVDLQARRHLPHALRAARALGDAAITRELERWKSEARVDSRAAAIFYVWYDELRRRIAADEYRGDRIYFPSQTLDRVLDSGGGAWVDDVRTPQRETLADLSNAAMRAAIATVGSRSWGEIHQTRIDHTLGGVKLLDRTFGLNIDPFPSSGSNATVNVAGYGEGPPFVNTNGPSMRHVVDMSDPDGAGGFAIPTGQSGLPFSSHYRDQTSAWREGRLWRIPLSRARAERVAVQRVTLEP